MIRARFYTFISIVILSPLMTLALPGNLFAQAFPGFNPAIPNGPFYGGVNPNYPFYPQPWSVMGFSPSDPRLFDPYFRYAAPYAIANPGALYSPIVSQNSFYGRYYPNNPIGNPFANPFNPNNPFGFNPNRFQLNPNFQGQVPAVNNQGLQQFPGLNPNKNGIQRPQDNFNRLGIKGLGRQR